MGTLGDVAARYAAHGWPVLPLHTRGPQGGCSCGRTGCSSPAKHPRTRQGLRNATTDPAVVTRWWHRWPHANVGVATGPASGLVVLDIDLPDGPTSLARLTARHGPLPATCQQLTGSGGRQFLFAHPAVRVRNRAGLLPGIDVRADGGYVVVPPSVHASGQPYRWVDRTRPAPMPTWLLALVRARPAACRPPSMPNPVAADDVHPYAAAALAGELDHLAAATEGTRNQRLNRAAFRLGQLVGGGALGEAQVRQHLDRVARQVAARPARHPFTETEIARTITSGLAAGAARPRGIPDRTSDPTVTPRSRLVAGRGR